MEIEEPSLKRDEWTRRYATQVQAAGLTAQESAAVANAAAESEESMARFEGREPDWSDPEGAADDEMSYWGD